MLTQCRTSLPYAYIVMIVVSGRQCLTGVMGERVGLFSVSGKWQMAFSAPIRIAVANMKETHVPRAM